MPNSRSPSWPELPYAAWLDTCATLHLWTQIVGKIRLALTPWLNHSWHVTLYVTVRGLTTSTIPYGSRSFEIEFDFLDHHLAMLRQPGFDHFRLAVNNVAVPHHRPGAAHLMRQVLHKLHDFFAMVVSGMQFRHARDAATFDPNVADVLLRLANLGRSPALSIARKTNAPGHKIAERFRQGGSTREQREAS